MRHFRFVLLLPLLLCTSCYSFTGASLPPHIKSIAVPIFGDESRSGVLQLREKFTAKMIEKVQGRSGLLLVQDRVASASVLECVITGYTNSPSVVSGPTERATQNRITLGLTATYRDLVKSKKLFEQSFNAFADYPIGNLPEQQLAIDKAIDNATEDVFNKMVSGW